MSAFYLPIPRADLEAFEATNPTPAERQAWLNRLAAAALRDGTTIDVRSVVLTRPSAADVRVLGP